MPEMIQCKCGCGNKIPKFGCKGRLRSFLRGHWMRPEGWKEKRSTITLCACGCGEQISPYRDNGFSERRTYLHNHHNKGKIFPNRPPRGKSIEVRFWERVNKTGTGTCWLWTSTVNNNGYGVISFMGKHQYAHRVSWFFKYGSFPKFGELDHICKTPRCINPEHLELVTHAENMRRYGAARGRIHKFCGRVIDGVYTRKNGKICRYCKWCNRERAHARTYMKNREKLPDHPRSRLGKIGNL